MKQREACSKWSFTFYPLHAALLLGLFFDPEDVPWKRLSTHYTALYPKA
jgi:hypothetical protein